MLWTLNVLEKNYEKNSSSWEINYYRVKSINHPSLSNTNWCEKSLNISQTIKVICFSYQLPWFLLFWVVRPPHPSADSEVCVESTGGTLLHLMSYSASFQPQCPQVSFSHKARSFPRTAHREGWSQNKFTEDHQFILQLVNELRRV